MKQFSQKIFKIGINPCVVPPQGILQTIFKVAGKDKGPIPVRGTIGGAPYKQTLVKYQGAWRLYINGAMLKASGLSNGSVARIGIEYDPVSRAVPTHPTLAKALAQNPQAKSAFKKLAPHRQKEINRYLANIKTDTTLKRSIETVIRHLLGKKVTKLGALLRTKY